MTINGSMRAIVAEFVGTFALVFVGAGAVVTDAWTNNGLGLVGVALANALVFAVMVTAMMNISGGHLNPAITVGVWLAKKTDGKTAVLYVITQLTAAIVGAFALRVLFPAIEGEATAWGTPKISTELSLWQAVALEAIMTLFLVSAFFGTIVSRDAPKVGGFAVGLVLLFIILAGAPLTGAAANPARAFGPAVIARDFEGHAAYWIGPLLGGLAAGGLWGRVLLPRDEG
jgi:MIP family channel proteins